VSETFPFSIVLDKITSQNNRDFARDIAATGSVLSNAQVAIYPVDAKALGGNSDFSVGNDPNPWAIGYEQTSLDGEAGKLMNREAEDRMASRSTMNDLAEKTGGKAYYNTTTLKVPFDEAWKTAPPITRWATIPKINLGWQLSPITVRVARPGVKLHYRLGYYAVEPQSYARLDQAEKTNRRLAKGYEPRLPAPQLYFFRHS